MTVSEFRSVVADYASVFPAWTRTKRNTIERVKFPVRQMIWFDRLSSGNYRPTNSVGTIPFNTQSVIHEMLDVKHRECNFRQHASRWKSIAAAMQLQFNPPLERDMDLTDLLALSRERTAEIPAPHPSYHLFEGVVAAWLGDLDGAAKACDSAISFADWVEREEPEWLTLVKDQARSLLNSIHDGSHKKLLAAANESTG